MRLLRFRLRTAIVVAGAIAWLVMLYFYGRTLLACVLLLGLGMLGLPVNTSGRLGEDPTHPLTVWFLFLFLVLPPLIPFGVYFVRKWRRREWP